MREEVDLFISYAKLDARTWELSNDIFFVLLPSLTLSSKELEFHSTELQKNHDELVHNPEFCSNKDKC